MLVGYIRVSSADQNTELQDDALRKAGCERFFYDVASGAMMERKGLAEAIAHARQGDALAVWKLDRLGRSLEHLVETVTTLNARCVVRERTKAGRNAALARGRHGGRPRKLDSRQVAMGIKLLEYPSMSVTEVCRTLRIGRTTLYRYIDVPEPVRKPPAASKAGRGKIRESA